MFLPCTLTEALSALKNCMKYLLSNHSTFGRHLLTFHKYSYECNGNYYMDRLVLQHVLKVSCYFHYLFLASNHSGNIAGQDWEY